MRNSLGGQHQSLLVRTHTSTLDRNTGVQFPFTACGIMVLVRHKEDVMPNQQPLITRDRDILGGAPVFAGTRVPVDTLLEYLAAGQSLNDFLDDFPTVQRAHALAVLDELKRLLSNYPYASAA